jgi:hypothetical protein
MTNGGTMATFVSEITGETVTMRAAGAAELLPSDGRCECDSDDCLALHHFGECRQQAGDDGMCSTCARWNRLEARDTPELKRRDMAIRDLRLNGRPADVYSVPEGFRIAPWIEQGWTAAAHAAFRTARRVNEAA